MEFRLEIRNDGIWMTSEFRLTTCSIGFFQFQYGNWFIEINVKPNTEDELEDILFIRIMDDGKNLFIGDYEITETTTISNNHYSIYFEKLD